MVLYRFLFAPVLLAIAVLIGSRERAAPPRLRADGEAVLQASEAPRAVARPTDPVRRHSRR